MTDHLVMADPLTSFSHPVRAWFSQTFGEPTPPQAQGWPPIQRGEHTLILAPTGSGKTLAAFLWGIDRILQAEAERAGDARRRTKYERRERPRAASSCSTFLPSRR